MLQQPSYKFAFFAYTYNLAEVTRAIEVARALYQKGNKICFFAHDVAYEHFITDAGFQLVGLTPIIPKVKEPTLPYLGGAIFLCPNTCSTKVQGSNGSQ